MSLRSAKALEVHSRGMVPTSTSAAVILKSSIKAVIFGANTNFEQFFSDRIAVAQRFLSNSDAQVKFDGQQFVKKIFRFRQLFFFALACFKPSAPDVML